MNILGWLGHLYSHFYLEENLISVKLLTCSIAMLLCMYKVPNCLEVVKVFSAEKLELWALLRSTVLAFFKGPKTI